MNTQNFSIQTGIEYLSSNLDKLSANERSFAKSLIRAVSRSDEPLLKHVHWIYVLIDLINEKCETAQI